MDLVQNSAKLPVVIVGVVVVFFAVRLGEL